MVLVSPSVLVSAICFISAYLCLAPFYRTSKQRAWIMTGLSSTLTSLAALPYFYDFILSGGRVEGLRPTTVWSDMAVGVFQGYLIADLLAGSIFYREHISLMTGWVHHTLYFALLQYVSTVGWSNIFCLALIMEVPTMLLALGSLHPRLRNDYLFAGVFFATRIVLHVVLILAYFFIYLNKSGSGPGLHEPELFRAAAPLHRVSNVTEVHSIGSPKPLDSPLPTLFFLAALPMHVMWFIACIKGILRRRSKAVTASQKPDMPIVLVSPFRARLQTIRGRLALDQETRERLRVRVQAAYGQARERMWRRQAWTRRTVGVDGTQGVEILGDY